MKPKNHTTSTTKVLTAVRSFIDATQIYRVRTPDGTLLEFSGEELICIAEAFAEMIEAAHCGDNQRFLAAFEELESADTRGPTLR